jgi:hypothetical protein
VPEQLWEHDAASEPEHVRFVFEGSAGANDLPRPAELRVYPAARYSEINSVAAGTMAVMGRLLAERPDLRQIYPAYLPVGEPTDPEGQRQTWKVFPPMLPWPGAATVITAHSEYLSSGEVLGLRYLAQTAHNYCWSGARDVTFYTFQGLSADGNWYVAAIFPVRVPFEIPRYVAPEPWDAGAYAATCDASNEELAGALEGTSRGSFLPDLGLLDELVLSVRTGVSGEPVTP